MSDTDLPVSRSGNDALRIATQAAREAGAIIKSRFSETLHIESKGKRNLVTEADLLAEQSILLILKDEYPSHSILCEESGKTEGASDCCWIIDPLDGTTNYAFGIPFCCVSIGLIRADEILLGLIYDPLRDELFRAQKGKGAFLNEQPVSVARRQDLLTTVVGLDLGYDDAKTREMLMRLNSIWSNEVALRLIGSAALGLAYVACGRMNVYLHRSIYPWDIAAGILLIREAGGEVTDWQGNPATVWNDSIFACGDLREHRAMLAALAESGDR